MQVDESEASNFEVDEKYVETEAPTCKEASDEQSRQRVGSSLV